MPDTQYKEVLITVLAVMLLFMVLATIILVFVFKYQQRRKRQQIQVLELQQSFKEQSLKSQIEIQEHTFHAISQEIHDNVGQLLSLAKIQVNILLAADTGFSEALETLKDNIGRSIAELRDLSRGLNSDSLKLRSIHETIQEEAGRIGRSGFIRVEVSVEGDCKELHPQKKLIVFRIVQECLQNCLKHASASEIKMLCKYRTDELVISIDDDGTGFDYETMQQTTQGQGLRNIHSRIQLAGGNYSIESVPQKGTRITLTIPYE